MKNDSFASWSAKLDQSIYSLNRVFKTQFENGCQSMEIKRMGAVEQALLDLMAWNPDLTVKKAIEMLQVPNSTLTSVINRLELCDILKREIHPVDRRTYILKTTEKGEEVIRINKFEKQQFYHDMLQGLDHDEERQLFVHLLEKIALSINDVDKNLIRRIHMKAIEKEYDMFGPWLTQIKEEDDIPQQYLHLKDQILGGLYAFKVPVNIEHRDAKIGMLLYNAVVTITDTKFRVFKYVEEAIDIKELEIKDIISIQYLENLLFGELIIVTASETVVVDFNPVSTDIVEKTVAILRGKYVSDVVRVDLDSINENVVVESHLYKSLIAHEMTKENVKLVEYQPFVELEKGRATNVEKRKESFHDPVLQESLFMTNGRELAVLSRVKEVKDEQEVDYGYKYTYMPLELIRSITVEQDLEFQHLQDLKIAVGDGVVSFKVGGGFSVSLLKERLKI